MARGRLRGTAFSLAVAGVIAHGSVLGAELDRAIDFAEWRGISIWTSHEECAVRAEQIGGAGQLWALDLCARVADATGTRSSLQVIDDELYVRTGDHVLAVDPGTGEVRGQWLGGVPEPKDPGPSKKSGPGCDCTLARSEPPYGLVLLSVIVAARLRRPAWRRSGRG
jgi:hypothetical protein